MPLFACVLVFVFFIHHIYVISYEKTGIIYNQGEGNKAHEQLVLS